MLPGMVHPQLLCVACSSVSPPSQGSHWILFLSAVMFPLNGISSFKCINYVTQLGIIHKLAEGMLSPTVYAINKDIEQCQSQFRSLRDTTCY